MPFGANALIINMASNGAGLALTAYKILCLRLPPRLRDGIAENKKKVRPVVKLAKDEILKIEIAN